MEEALRSKLDVADTKLEKQYKLIKSTTAKNAELEDKVKSTLFEMDNKLSDNTNLDHQLKSVKEKHKNLEKDNSTLKKTNRESKSKISN